MSSVLSRALLASVFMLALQGASKAESLAEAMAAAYANNPTLNAARAGTRATDEGVPQALAGYRPRINAFTSTGVSYNNAQPDVNSASIVIGFSFVQPIFDGYQTVNSTKAAEAAVLAARENLRNTEQNVLLDTVSAYMDVVAYSSILSLRQSSVGFLAEQVRSTRLRLQAGESTSTDVAQTEAALAAAESLASLAKANLDAARASYVQVVGHEPKKLGSAKAADSYIPKSIDKAVSLSRSQHPAILAAIHNADTAAFNVKVAEGSLLPSVTIEATGQRTWLDNGGPVDGAQLMGKITVPLYNGGGEYSRVRQAKETSGQFKIFIDSARAQVEAALIGSWGRMEAARAQGVAAASQVAAARLALDGVIEEQKVGQRTTLDVLNAQNTLVNAQIAQVSAMHDTVVAGYSVLAATGGLSHDRLGLKVAAYNPAHHYEKVRDKWVGLRTPDGQ